VWLAAHERKLTKAQLLQTSIVRSTQAIVEQDEVPLALRLSGQLLLGVVRIYSRKARYLLDDCNEALMKIKLVTLLVRWANCVQAFRPGNVDLPAAQTVSSHALLTLPDTLTELDLLAPPDPTLLHSASLSHGGQDYTLLPAHTMDLSLEYPRGLADEEDPLSQFPLEGDVLDFALDDNASAFSVERGRDAASVGLDDEFGSVTRLDDDLGFGKGAEDDGLGGGFGDSGLDFGGFGDDFNMQLDVPPNGKLFHCFLLWD
jgi:cohesin complex subunit SCC1